MSTKNRLLELDILKGIGILFVILGHSVPDFPVNLRDNIISGTLESVLYGFHMPLFFLSAGFVLQMTDSSSGISVSWICKKVKRLLVPYIVFSFVSLTLRLIFSSFTRSSVDIGSSVYAIIFEGKYFWFLYVMFLALTVIEALKTMKVNLRWQLLIAFILFIIGLYTDSSFLCLNRLGYYLIYTILGMAVYLINNDAKRLLSKWYVSLIMVGLFMVFFNQRISDCIFIKELSRFGMAISGTAVTYSISIYIYENCKRLSVLLSYFGRMSLQYYLIHMIISLPIYYLVASLGIQMPLLQVLVIFFITTFLTYIIVEIMSRMPVCWYVLGMTRRK